VPKRKRQARELPPTGYRGVSYRCGRYVAAVRTPERLVYAGSWPDEEGAAIARDRVVLYFELDRPLNRPSASRRLGPASPEQLRAQVRRRPPKTSLYIGVRRTETGWQANLTLDGVVHNLGRWPDEKRAAVARDRAVLFFGLAAALNLPRTSRRLGAASVEVLRREATLVSPHRKFIGHYIGVTRAADGGFHARIYLGDRRGDRITHIASFSSEKNAAIAYDRVARRMRPDAPLNFPERRYRPASIEQMRTWARKVNQLRRGKWNRFAGVNRLGDRWAAALAVKIGAVKQTLYLGTWTSEREAALARDRAVLHYGCTRARINFPEEAADLVPADAASLVAEAARARQRSSK
jgi:hypothetical protein